VTVKLPRTSDIGIVLFDEKNRVVARLNGGSKKIIAFVEFSDMRFDLSDIILQALNSPISYTRLMELCWKRIQNEIQLVKNNPKFAAIFTRIEVGRGLQTMRSRLSQIVDFVYNFWYDSDTQWNFERERYENNYRSSLNRRIDRQNYYFGNQN